MDKDAADSFAFRVEPSAAADRTNGAQVHVAFAEDDTEAGIVSDAVTASTSPAPKLSGSTKKHEYVTGRIYHDEHFVMGTVVPGYSLPTAAQKAALTDGMAASQTCTAASPFDLGPLATPEDLNAVCDTAIKAECNTTTNSGALPRAVRAALHAAATAPAPAQLLQSRTGVLMHAVTTVNGRAPAGVIPAPSIGTPAPIVMPKWPANHQSAAFEAVAPKKSYILSPPEIYAECAHHGHEKSTWSWYKLFFLSIIAGCYVGFGYTTCLLIGGLMSEAPSNANKDKVNVGAFRAVFGAMGFPFGFTTIVVCGADLYTSLCAYTAAAFWEGKISALTTLRMLVMSWVGNFMGCAIMVGLFNAAYTYKGRSEYLVFAAEDKLHYAWGAVFTKGILANWLVGIATWMANAAQDLSGKFFGIWLPISAFAAVGYEHCVANMFLLPMAISQGATISAKEFVWHNLIPATLGNWVGGAVCVATTYAMVYGRTPVRIANWWHQHVEQLFVRGDAKKAK